MQLWIGNKNYSSWSMRPWVLMKQLAIPFEEVMVRFDGMGPDSAFKQRIAAVNPAARVPVLVDGGLTVWDSLAIAEYLAEKFPALPLWPREPARRALARCMCAEMHAGFSALRSHCPMNLEASLHDVGAKVLAEQPGVAADLARIVQMWTAALAQSGGPWLCGEFGIVDAYYAPVAGRIRTYGLPVPAEVAAYVDRVFGAPGVAAWVRDALAEHDFVDFDEPYRKSRN